MKNVAILAFVLGILGNAANAESAVSEAPNLTLALNTSAAALWVETEAAISIDTDALANKIELKVSKTIEQVSIDLDKQLGDKIAKEIEYAMH